VKIKALQKFHYKGKTWCASKFEWHYVPDQISGVDYAGFTLFGHSVLYSDWW
jgi:hypothetical protein